MAIRRELCIAGLPKPRGEGRISVLVGLSRPSRVVSGELSELRERARKLLVFRLYNLRHTFASLLPATSAPITYVSVHFGHVNPSTTIRYCARWIPNQRSPCARPRSAARTHRSSPAREKDWRARRESNPRPSA